MADGNNEVMVPIVEPPEGMAKLTITFNGQQGDLPDPVSYDSTDGDLKQMATEAVRDGYIPGIDAAANADFTDFVVDRFPARDDVPFNRLSLRPKTPFGAEKACTGCGIKQIQLDALNRGKIVDGLCPMCRGE